MLTEPLPSNDREIHIQIYRVMGRIYEVVIEMGSGATIYIQKLIGREYTDTQTGS
jgi:hypothetical protein